jgi:hypothetical protein
MKFPAWPDNDKKVDVSTLRLNKRKRSNPATKNDVRLGYWERRDSRTEDPRFSFIFAFVVCFAPDCLCHLRLRRFFFFSKLDLKSGKSTH